MSDYAWREGARQSIKFHEGFSASPYRDTEGFRTVGWGHLLTPDDAEYLLPESASISLERAEDLFEQDFQRAIGDAMALVPTFGRLDAPIKIALTDMAFNLGRSRLGDFKNLLAELSLQNPRRSAVAEHMLDSKWARQTGRRPGGLVDLIMGGPIPGSE